jgi:hypothetical protein
MPPKPLRAREIIRKLERQGSFSVGNAAAMLGMCIQTGGVSPFRSIPVTFRFR